MCVVQNASAVTLTAVLYLSACLACTVYVFFENIVCNIYCFHKLSADYTEVLGWYVAYYASVRMCRRHTVVGLCMCTYLCICVCL